MSVRGKSLAHPTTEAGDWRWFPLAWVLAAAISAACSSGNGTTETAPAPETSASAPDVFDVAIPRIASDLEAAFNDGDVAFSRPVTDADGLGPLYTRVSCDAC